MLPHVAAQSVPGKDAFFHLFDGFELRTGDALSVSVELPQKVAADHEAEMFIAEVVFRLLLNKRH